MQPWPEQDWFHEGLSSSASWSLQMWISAHALLGKEQGFLLFRHRQCQSVVSLSVWSSALLHTMMPAHPMPCLMPPLGWKFSLATWQHPWKPLLPQVIEAVPLS